MELIVLGSGTAVPHAERSSASHWLQTNSGSLLLDLSAPAIHRMAQENLDWANLDAIWISHFHLDHVGGLAPFLFGTRHAPQTRERRKPLSIFGPRGTSNLLRAFDAAYNYKLWQQPFPVELREVEPNEEFEILPGRQASTLKTPHTEESLALRVNEADGTSLVYTSDTGYAKELAAFARQAHLLIMECSFPRNKPVEKHLELVEAMQIAEEAAPDKVLLSHLYPEWDGIKLESEARKLWPGETIEARDGLRLRIKG